MAAQGSDIDDDQQMLFASHKVDHEVFIGRHNDTSNSLDFVVGVSPFTSFLDVGIFSEVANAAGRYVDIACSGDAYSTRVYCAPGEGWWWTGEYRADTPADDLTEAIATGLTTAGGALSFSLSPSHADVVIRQVVVREVMPLSALA
jgi:hypothetical protein